MTPHVKNANKRLPAGRLLMSMMQALCETHFKQSQPAATAGEMLLSVAVFIGHAEGRPMNATKLAHFAGMPRATVLRKLDRMQSMGIVEKIGNVYVINAERVNSIEALRLADKYKQAIISTADELLKMNASQIADNEANPVLKIKDDAA